MRILKFIYYKWNERKRMYIIDEFNDYEKFIEEQQKAASKIKDKTFKISAILNLYNGYYFTNQLEKAEEVIKSLDIESLDNSLKCAYYYYLINHYIATSNEIMLDKFWEESQNSLEELRQNDAQLYRKLKINYNNFKGLYEESNKILLEADYDEKGDIFYDLLKTETYFNIGKENEAKLIINDLPKDNKKLPPIFKKKVKELQVRYMNVENEGFINKDKTNEKISFKDKVWLKFRDLDFMRNLLLLFIYVKNILKNKHVLVVFGIIIATYLWEFIGIIGLRNNIYWNYWTHFMLDIFNKVFMINIMILLLKYMIKSKKYLKTMLVTLIMLSSMGFIFYVQPYSSTLMAIIKDLPYVVSKSYVEEVTTIEYINMVDEIDYQYMEIKTSNKINFELFNNNDTYNYIMENCYEGDVVKIKYLPNTKDIIYFKLEDITE
ncbi:MAG TPA: hypothetical protein DCL31_17970 [Clostridium sp.]|nr:hypothetical protein [Clostridium sp.]